MHVCVVLFISEPVRDFELMPSKTCCVRLISRVFVECSGRNPCCVGTRGTSGWIMFSIRPSVILDGVQSSVMGL